MLTRLWRLSLVVALFVVGILAGRALGSTRSTGAQLALTYRESVRGGDASVLIDIVNGVRYRLIHPRYHANIQFLGWANHDALIIMYPVGFDLAYYATFTIGGGWSDGMEPILPINHADSRGWNSRSDDTNAIAAPDDERLILSRRATNRNLWNAYTLDRQGNLRDVAHNVSSIAYDWRPCPEAGC